MHVDIVVAIIGMAGMIGTAVVSGIFSSRAFLKKQLTHAQKQADERHKQNHDRATATRHLTSCICRVLFWISFALDKSEIATNGEAAQLKEAMEAVNLAEAKLKEIERGIVADQQATQ